MNMLTLIRGGAEGKTAHEALEAARQRFGNEAFKVYLDTISRNRLKTVDCATGLPAPQYRNARARRAIAPSFR
jgi:hypothetical protein